LLFPFDNYHYRRAVRFINRTNDLFKISVQLNIALIRIKISVK